jgi:hypothetical protein
MSDEVTSYRGNVASEADPLADGKTPWKGLPVCPVGLSAMRVFSSMARGGQREAHPLILPKIIMLKKAITISPTQWKRHGPN